MKFVKEIIFTKSSQKIFQYFLVQIVIQQVSVFYSSFYINELIQNSKSRNLVLKSLYLIAFFMCIDFILVIPIRRFEISSIMDSYRDFYQKYLVKRNEFWSSQKHRESFLTAISSKAYYAISGYIVNLSEIIRFSLSFVLSSILFIKILDKFFIIPVLLNLLINFILHQTRKPDSVQLAESFQKKELEFFNYLQRSWDSVILGNLKSKRVFEINNQNNFIQWKEAQINSFNQSELTVVLSGFLGFLPFILSDIIFLFKMNFSMLSIGSLVALIPRQISLINSARAIFQLLSFWRISCVSWQEVLEAVKLSENVFSQLENRIQLSKIRINDQYFDSLEKVLNYIHQTEQQVITIQGSNGSGKSTLLTYIHKIQKNSFYLPTSVFMEISSEQSPKNMESLSTGQRMKSYLEDLINSDEQILLLDEWDANLDPFNFKRIEKLIEQISRTKKIIQVRHLKDVFIDKELK